MFIQRKKYLAQKEAASFIQRRYRAHVETLNARSQFLEKRRAVITIQASIKCFIARSAYKKKRSSAVLIQSLVRMRIQKKEYEKTRETVIMCQRWLRAKNTVRKDRNTFLAKRHAAIKIQVFFFRFSHI